MGFPHEGMRHRGAVAKFVSAPVRLLDQFARAVGRSPNCHTVTAARTDTTKGLVASWKRSCVSLFALGKSQASVRALLAVHPRLEKISGEVTGQGKAAAGDARLPRPAPCPLLLSGSLIPSSRADRNSPRK